MCWRFGVPLPDAHPGVALRPQGPEGKSKHPGPYTAPATILNTRTLPAPPRTLGLTGS
jgi:hypothetical protein